MPISESFAQRLYPRLPDIAQTFGTPFHIYDEVGIADGIDHLNHLFRYVADFREYFAVKATPNLEVMKLLRAHGCGFDCSAESEVLMARQVGARGEHIMFTSNNTSPREYSVALKDDGCILNLDDISFVAKVPDPFPELICFRFNPGERRTGNAIIGEPLEAKYGITHAQFFDAYRQAMARGARRFGIHTMVVSNERDYRAMVATVQMLLDQAEYLLHNLGIEVEFINIGGGIGIPYHRTEHQSFDLEALAQKTGELMHGFDRKLGFKPRLLMESGRWVTGPHGVLVTRALNVMEKYRHYVGVDACMSSLMRPGMYDAYHHLSVLTPNGVEKTEPVKRYDVVGSLCENNDKFAKLRLLPVVEEGDLVVIQDTGAHGIAMGFQYNARLRPAELLLKSDGAVKLIRRRETHEDYINTQVDLGHGPHLLPAKS